MAGRSLTRFILLFALLALVLGTQAAAVPKPAKPKLPGLEGLAARGTPSPAASRNRTGSPVLNNFELLGHTDLGASDTNGDVWALGDYAYVGTWSEPCSGRGVKIVDVRDLTAPKLVATAAGRYGTSAEDVVVRSVATSFFHGTLLATGIQRCPIDDPALDTQTFGVELWNVSNPAKPAKLGEIGLTNGGGGAHEIDLFQRGSRVYVLAATPSSEWFDPFPQGEFRIIDATDPRNPVQIAQWGAGANGLSRGPYWGFGSFGASFAHSVRASADGTKAYVSYWDLGILTFDISNPSNPILIGRTRLPHEDDGDTHSTSIYSNARGTFLLENDEDFDPTSPSFILAGGKTGLGQNSPSGPPIWLLPGRQLAAHVVAAANQGCSPSDYTNATGKIAVAKTIDPIFAPVSGEFPECLEAEQEAAAEAAGAVAIVHDFRSEMSSPQWFDVGEVSIPVLFTDKDTAAAMVAARFATLVGRTPSWGYMRVYNAATGEQVAKFDAAPNVHTLPAPPGFWSIHNNEVARERSYASWYSNGIVALDLGPLNRAQPGDPVMVGQFVPPPGPSPEPFLDGVTVVWGVALRTDRHGRVSAIFASDMNTGLWIVRPTGLANG